MRTAFKIGSGLGILALIALLGAYAVERLRDGDLAAEPQGVQEKSQIGGTQPNRERNSTD
jgi:hypothetical protein